MKFKYYDLKSHLFVTFISFSVLSALAFEGWEHEDLGNIAVRANILSLQETLKSPPPDGNQTRVKQALEYLEILKNGVPVDAKNPVTYGSIVRLVDFMRDNYGLMHRRNSGSGWPKSPEETDFRHLQELSSDYVSGASAAHANQDHFQGRVFYSYWFWHKQAVETASEGNLWGALLMNAYADHFLQDSFAPGHIISPRDENSHDLWAAIVHDSANKGGMDYCVRDPKQCHPALKKLLPLTQSDSVKSTSFLKGNKRQVWLSREATEAFLNEQQTVTVECYGDNLINKTTRQPILVSANCIQSLSDVIDSFIMSKPCNSFGDYRWRLRYAVSKVGQLELIDVWRSYGDLICVDRKLDEDKETRDMCVVVAEGANCIKLSALDENIVSSLTKVSSRNPAFALNVGLQGITEPSGAHVRTLTELEMMIAGARWDYAREDFPSYWKWPGQAALTLGYSGVFNSSSVANGLMTRFIVPIPKLNAQLSVFAGGRYYTGNSVEEWGDFEGVRFEWGMHLGNLFFGVGHDHYPVRGHGLEHGVAVEAGFSFALPWSRVPKPKFGNR